MKLKHQVLTPEGRERLRSELDHLRRERRAQAIERLRRLREQGAGQTYGEYQEAKDELAFVDGRVRELESLLAEAEVASTRADGSVALGCRVVVVDDEGTEEGFTIVGTAEADPRARRISHESPVGQALIGRRPGEEVLAQTPAGPLRLRIVAVL
jgi:transcription elongation factor GreA